MMMRRPTAAEVRFHAARWIWVVLLAVLAYVAFPSARPTSRRSSRWASSPTAT